MKSVKKTPAGRTLSPATRKQILSGAVASVKKLAKAGRIRSRKLTRMRASTRAATAGPFTKLRLELTRVKCHKLTRELGEKGDEMTLGGVAILSDLSTQVIGPFELAQFTTDGQVQDFDPPKEVGTFTLGASFPQTCVAVLQACENDGNGAPEQIPDLLAELVAEIKKDVGKALETGDGESTLDQIQRTIDEVQRIVGLFGEPDKLLEELLKLIGKSDELFPPRSQASWSSRPPIRSEPGPRSVRRCRFALSGRDSSSTGTIRSHSGGRPCDRDRHRNRSLSTVAAAGGRRETRVMEYGW